MTEIRRYLRGQSRTTTPKHTFAQRGSPCSIPHEDAVHCLDWHRRVNTAHLHGFKDDFPSYVVSAFLCLPRIRLLVHRAEPVVRWRACLVVGHSMSWQSFDRGS